MKAKFTYVDQNKHTGKWYVCFDVYRKRKGVEYTSELVSYAKYDTEEEAKATGQRAMQVQEQTGKFPDITKDF